eukprot:scaffold33326_cov242-Isochrysis_galbana.AAC.3
MTGEGSESRRAFRPGCPAESPLAMCSKLCSCALNRAELCALHLHDATRIQDDETDRRWETGARVTRGSGERARTTATMRIGREDSVSGCGSSEPVGPRR